MKKSSVAALTALLLGSLIGSSPLFAAPGLPITKPPVLSPGAYQHTGPNIDPTASQGQWFLNPNTQKQESRAYEFYDNAVGSGGGTMSAYAISGYVSRVSYDVTTSAITNFEITAIIVNDCGSEVGTWADGTNSHQEVLQNYETGYKGTLKNVKLTADFAIIGDLAAPPPPPFWVPPYYDTPAGYIESVNEDQWAWYCWNENEQGAPGGTGDYHVPTWDFGDIAAGGFAKRIMMFQVRSPGITTNDPRYAVLNHSYSAKADILLNRTTSLKISDWIDTVAVDSGMAYQLPPGISSDVSVFFDKEELDFGDAPYDGTTNKYPTLLVQDGARHGMDTNVTMGLLIDSEANGQPDAMALGDDNNNLPDEDGVLPASGLYPGLIAKTDVFVSTNGFINAWMDFGSDGSWVQAEDYILKEVAVTSGVNHLAFKVSTNAVAGAQTFIRVRYSTYSGITNFYGYAPDGEVEDYTATFDNQDDPEGALDFGDAPDSYQTLLSSTGARHHIAGPWLGDINGRPDPENDGQPDADALGDDLDGHDDERGVWIATGTSLIRGVTTNYSVTVNGGGGVFQMWVDWDRDGHFDPTNELVADGFLPDGTHYPEITPPPNASVGTTYARCRISTSGGLSPIGFATDGEVEDHKLVVDDGYVDWGRLQWPTNTTITTYVGTDSENIYGRCWHNGLTPPSTNAAPGLQAELGFGPDGSDTPWDTNWTWIVATFNSQTMEPNNDEYVAVLNIGSTGRYDYAYRYSLNGFDWTYADADGSNNGYTNTQAGDIVVTTLPAFSITNIEYSATSTTATIWWPAEARVVYRLQYALELATNTTVWTNIGGEVTGPANSQNDPNATTTRFYRVVAPYAR